jgi:hypothetical protein
MPSRTINGTDTAALRLAKMLATNARHDLSSNADRGTSARPTVAQLNRTLDRLASIENLLNGLLVFAAIEAAKGCNHVWLTTDDGLLDCCKLCGEERA